MRLVWLGVLAACGNDYGAQLALHAPSGPGSAAAFQIVLGSPQLIPMVMNQRVSPASTQSETVTYYLQRTSAGLVPASGAIDKVDGFTVRIEPNPDLVDRAFIPFLLLRDGSGALIGMGTYRAPGQTKPSPILVQPDEIDEYTLEVEPVTQVDDAQPVAASDALLVTCARKDQSTFESGVVWRTGAGEELRVLFPAEPGSTDATQRALDLDCDDHVADAGGDCDDTRASFHQDAAETCDGLDTNCDGRPYLAVACSPTTPGVCVDPMSGQGVALCDDRTGAVGTCQSDPQCLCATGATSCTKCQIKHPMQTMAGAIQPCQPGIGTLSTQGQCDGGDPCTVDVLAVRGGWEALVAASTSGPFGKTATGVGSSFVLLAKRPEGPGATIPGDAGHHTGEVELAVTDAQGIPHLMGVDLVFDGDVFTTCSGNGPFPMTCSP